MTTMKTTKKKTKKKSVVMHKKAAKLQRLADVMDLETGEILDGVFADERVRYDKAVRMKRVVRRLRECRRCKGMNVPGVTEVCVPWGNLNADIVIVGQSPHKLAVKSDVPFVLESGLFLDAACRLSGIRRDELLIYNAVACHPVNNRASKDEWKEQCRPYLGEVLDIVFPRLVVTLGNDAAYSVSKVWTGKTYHATHPAAFLHGSYGSDVVIDWVVKLSDQFDKVLDKNR